jgi:hypothetical protein
MKREYLAENERALDEIGSQLSRRGIDLVLVTLPVSRFYSEGMDAAIYEQMLAVAGSMCSKYHARYLNHTFDDQFTDRDFGDADHLNLKGARKFTAILSKEVFSAQNAGGVAGGPAHASLQD